MNWAEIKTNDIANGEGVRTSLFVSGCRHHCKNCFNDIAWDFGYGELFTEETMEKIFDSIDHPWINGVTLLGGEPFEPENQRVLVPFLVMLREKFPDKTVWCYTGFTIEQILGKSEPKSRAATDVSNEMLSLIDVLVDGPYVESLHDISLKFRGSSNQRVIDMKNQSKAIKSCFILNNKQPLLRGLQIILFVIGGVFFFTKRRKCCIKSQIQL